MEQKLVVCIMGQNCERFLEMCIKSVLTADEIIYCDGGSKDTSIDICNSSVWGKNIRIISNSYNQEDKSMNGKQRNFYLNYLKDKYPNDWALCLDADEIVEDLSKIKEFINSYPEGVYSVKMRHLIGDLGHEDSTVPEHFVPNRLFKISCADKYPEVEHPVLQPTKGSQVAGTRATTIWHLAYVPNMWEIKKRYDNHMKKSNMHTPEFLKQWYYQHLFGQYPRSQFNLTDLPEVLLNNFGIDKDEFYFANRGVETKHFVMALQWMRYVYNKFNMPYDVRMSVIEYGCGRGPYGYAFSNMWCDYKGVELSKWAVNNSFLPIEQGDITSWDDGKEYDLCLLIDVLEHLDDCQLESALRNVKGKATLTIFSIPFEGDPNLYNDKTHKQFRTKENWIKLLEEKGFKITEAPKEWAFSHQLLIGEFI